ncbi:MEDS domain-containing protein [Halopiger aswanensis]|uniref:histidine kinase n=1 Tax=Halopiger aswanensis TaxID=148449 RepID=A0A419WKK9_9EURY|nr:MEDS domain-containing protein [Halopiger aswanensis]RKD95961.1 light-regulated signal transduction histidine kinase (bacteriophytochrome) [Halopiger aswanensis]
MSETSRNPDGEEPSVLENEFEPPSDRTEFPDFRGPVAPLEGHETVDHFGLIYETQAERLAAVVPYIAQGLERGERCMYIRADSSREAVLEALRNDGIDVDAALESGQLSVHPAAETYLDGGAFDVDEGYDRLERAKEAAHAEYEGFRVTAEETWLVDDEHAQEAFMSCEAHVNDLVDGEESMALCQYDRTELPPDVIEDVIRTHPYLIYDGTVCQNVFYTPPEEYFGPDRPARENERKLRTLVDRTDAEAALETEEWAQRQLYAIAADPHRSFEEKIDDLLAFGREVFDLEIGGMARVDPAADYYRIEAISGSPDGLEAGTEIPLSDTYCREVVQNGPTDTVPMPTELSTVTGELPESKVRRSDDVQAYLGTCVPIEGDLDRTFFFTSSDPSDGAFSDRERTFLRLMGQWVKYEFEQRRHERLLRDLYETIADPQASFGEKVEGLLELGSERFGLDIGYFTQTDDDETFEIIAAVGDHDEIRAGVRDTLRDTYCEKLLASPGPISVTDAAEVGWTDDRAYERFGLDAYFATTVHAGGEEYGTLCFASESPRDRTYSDSERTFLDLMGQWLGYELEQRRRVRYLQESYEITSDPALSFDEKLERLLELGRERFGLEMGGLNHLPSWDGAFRLEKGVGLDVASDEELGTDPGAGCFCRRTIASDEPVDTTDARESGWTRDEIYREFGLTSYLGTKVSTGSSPYGTLWFGSTDPRDRPFTDDERTFVELIGQWIGYEIERRKHRRSQEKLYEITADSDLSFDEKAERLLDLGREQFDLDMGFLLEKEGDAFRVVKTEGTDLEEGSARLSANPGNYCKQTITVETPVGVEDVEAVGWDDDPLHREYGLGCYLGTRVTDGDGVYGSVCFSDSSAQDRDFTDADYAFLDLIGQWLSYELERDERERRLERSNDRLEESNKRLEQFAYAASHDLQEPLRMVSSYLQLLESRYEDALDEEGTEFLGFAVDGADRMREMIGALLQYSRVETQGDPLEPVDLEDVFEGVREDLRVQIEEADAEITVGSLPRVRGDASQLRQVFQNLLSNAITYSGDEPPRIRVRAEKRGRKRAIAVEDDGIGIPPDEQDRIFDIFDRLHSREEYDGTGIGLALCERIVERHGGEIWVDSEPGEGATFSFTLRQPRSSESGESSA